MGHSVWFQVHTDSVLLCGFVGAIIVSLLTTGAPKRMLPRLHASRQCARLSRNQV